MFSDNVATHVWLTKVMKDLPLGYPPIHAQRECQRERERVRFYNSTVTTPLGLPFMLCLLLFSFLYFDSSAHCLCEVSDWLPKT